MTHHIFYDPSLFPSLTTLLTHSLNKLSTTHTLTYTLVPNIQSLIHKNENRGEVSVAIIVCMPREYGTYKALIERNDSPRFRPRILSPMWIISSALSCRLQPMECYIPSTTATHTATHIATTSRIFSSLVVSLTALSNESLQRVYAACIQHNGGQVVCLQPHQPHMYFCTHVIHDVSPQSNTNDDDIEVNTEDIPIHVHVPMCQKYSMSTSDNLSLQLLHMYRFLVSFELHSHTSEGSGGQELYNKLYEKWCERPSNVGDLLPIEVSSDWLEACLTTRKRVSELSYLVHSNFSDKDGVARSLVHSFRIDDLPESWKQQICMSADLGPVSTSSTGGAQSIGPSAPSTSTLLTDSHGSSFGTARNDEGDDSRSYSTHEQLFLKHMCVSLRKRSLCVFTSSDIFVVSEQYEGVFRACLISAIRYLGGTVKSELYIASESSSADNAAVQYVVCRDRSCDSLRNIAAAYRTGYEAVTDLYIFACTDYAHRLPLNWNADWTSKNSFPAPHPQLWSAIYPDAQSSTLDVVEHEQTPDISEDMFSIVANCFAPLYRPLPEFAVTNGGIPGMSSLVICISGYSNLKHACDNWARQQSTKKRKHGPGGEIEEAGRGESRFRLSSKSGSLEIQHAVRLCGSCFIQPMMPSLTSHLICANPKGRKYEAALAHNTEIIARCNEYGGQSADVIHIVSEDWLWQSLREWRRLDESLFRVGEESNHVTDTDLTIDAAARDSEQDLTCPRVGIIDAPIAESQLMKEGVSTNSTNQDVHSQKSSLILDAESIANFANDGEAMDVDAVAGALNSPTADSCPISSPKISAISPNLSNCSSQPISQSLPSSALSPTASQSQSSFVSLSTSLAPKKFLLGGGSSKRHKHAREVIEALGGIVLTTSGGAYDPSCTHLLLWRFERTEKCMCACAAGKWVLYPESYLKECERSGHFVPEKDFEWYFPNEDLKQMYHFAEDRAPWLGACRRGRERRLSNALPFQNLKCVDFIDTEDLVPPLSILSTLLVAGGGEKGQVLTKEQFWQRVTGEGDQKIQLGRASEVEIGMRKIVVCSPKVKEYILLESQNKVGLSKDGIDILKCIVPPTVLIDVITQEKNE